MELMELERARIKGDIPGKRYNAELYDKETEPTNEDKSFKELSRVRQILLLLGGCYLRSTSSGALYGLSVIHGEIVNTIGIQRKKAALLQSIFSLCLYGGTFFFSWAVKQFGPGMSSVVGAIVSSIGFFACINAPSITVLVLCMGVLGGLGSSILYISSLVMPVWIFGKDEVVPLIVVSFGSSVGQFLYPYLMEVTLQAFSLNGTYILMGVLAASCLFVGIGMQFSRDFYYKGNDTYLCDFSFLCDPVFIFVQINVALFYISVLDQYFIVDVMQTRGYERSTGSYLLVVIAVGGMFGKMIAIPCSRVCKKPTVLHWSYCCILIGLSHVTVVNTKLYWLLFIEYSVIGMSLGMVTSQIPVVTLETVRLEHFPQAQGTVTLCIGLGISVGVIICGFLKDVGWSYDDIYYLMAGISLCVGVSSLAIALFCMHKAQTS